MIGEIFRNLSVFEWVYDGAIIIWALIIFISLKSINTAMKEIKEKTAKAYSSAKSETKLNSDGNPVEATSRTFNREKHEPIRAEFIKQAVKYIKWSNLISTLPLAGLLGTVLGLMPGLLAVKEQNFDSLYSSMSTALTSTAVGLIAALLLKIYVSYGPDANINEVELQFDNIDRRYDNAIGLSKLKDS